MVNVLPDNKIVEDCHNGMKADAKKNWAERQEEQPNFAGFVIAHQGIRESAYQAHSGSAAGILSGQIQGHEGEA